MGKGTRRQSKAVPRIERRRSGQRRDGIKAERDRWKGKRRNRVRRVSNGAADQEEADPGPGEWNVALPVLPPHDILTFGDLRPAAEERPRKRFLPAASVCRRRASVPWRLSHPRKPLGEKARSSSPWPLEGVFRRRFSIESAQTGRLARSAAKMRSSAGRRWLS